VQLKAIFTSNLQNMMTTMTDKLHDNNDNKNNNDYQHSQTDDAIQAVLL